MELIVKTDHINQQLKLAIFQSVHGKEQLGKIVDIVSNPFLRPLIDSGDYSELSKLALMSFYNFDLYVKDVYRVTVGRSAGPTGHKRAEIRGISNRRVLWFQDDDAFATVYRDLVYRFAQDYHIDSSLSVSNTYMDTDFESVWNTFRKEEFDKYAVPHLDHDYRSMVDKYRNAYEAAKEYPLETCDAKYLHYWAKLLQTISDLFLIFRKKNHQEWVPYPKMEKPITYTKILGDFDGFVPAVGDKFRDHELMFIEDFCKENEAYKDWRLSVMDSGKQCYCATGVDIFYFISSCFMQHKPLPEMAELEDMIPLPAEDPPAPCVVPRIELPQKPGCSSIARPVPAPRSRPAAKPFPSGDFGLKNLRFEGETDGDGVILRDDGHDHARKLIEKYVIREKQTLSSLKGQGMLKRIKEGHDDAQKQILSRVSKRQLAGFRKTVPEEMTAWPQVVAHSVRAARWPGDFIGDISTFLACRVILTQGSLQAELRDGEIYVGHRFGKCERTSDFDDDMELF